MKPSRLLLLLPACLATVLPLSGQVAVNSTGADPDASAMLDVSSTDRGVLLPRLTTAQRDQIPTPANGLMVYNLDLARFQFFNGSFWTTLTPDGDSDPGNELQTLSQNGTTVTLSNGGGSVDVTDGDANPTNELQVLSRSGTTVTLNNPGGATSGSVSIADADADPVNEIQTLSLNGNSLSLSNGGGSVDVSDADNDPTNELDSPWTTNGNDVFVTGKRVGINAGNPSHTLDVAGSLRIRGGDPAPNRVLTAIDNTGAAEWATPVPASGNSIYETSQSSVHPSGDIDYRQAGPTLQLTGVNNGDRVLVMVNFRCTLDGQGSGDDDFAFRVEVNQDSGSGATNSRWTGVVETIDQHRDHWLHMSFHRIIECNFSGTANFRVAVRGDGNANDALLLSHVNLVALNLK